MKKIVIALSVIAAGCSVPKTAQYYPHYHTIPTITQSAGESNYWESVHMVPPRYPQGALSRGTSGCATIGFTITPDGTIADPFVIKSVPDGVFDRTSIEAALQFKYKASAANLNREAVISSNVFTYGLNGVNRDLLAAKCN